MTAPRGRLTIVQVAGDFREAALRLAAGGPETYRAQRYTVEFVERLAGRLAAVTTITCQTLAAYDVVLPSGARAIGAGPTDRVSAERVIERVEATSPDLLILRSPSFPLLRWARRHRVRTLLLLADSFDTTRLRGRARLWRFARLASGSPFDLIANHGFAAARQLAATSIPAGKIVAWDYPHEAREPLPPKPGPAGERLIYVGALTAEKGVDDLLRAVAALRGRRAGLSLQIVGADADQRVAARVARLGLESAVSLAGTLPNAAIIPAMRAADLVIVPSRPVYSEALPLTIGEALASRTPLIASDHPMFVSSLVDGEAVVFFRAGDARDLAAQIDRVLSDGPLYGRLSAGAPAAAARLRVPTSWGEVIEHWLEGPASLSAWLERHSLAAMPGP